MKEILKKIMTIFVLIAMIFNSSLLLIISNAVDSIEQSIDESKVNVLQEIKLEKYINYNIGNSKGLLTQYNLKTGIKYRNNEDYAPLDSTGILLNLPKIQDEYPEEVKVIAKSTKATNGSENAKDFIFDYDKEKGALKIAVVNQTDEEGNIYDENIEGARDEYTIICYYSSNCYDENNTERDLEVNGFVQANIAEDIQINKKVEINETHKVSENISGLVTTEISTSDIYNGYINSNKLNSTNYETEYIENFDINIAIKEISDEINISTEHSFLENNEIETNDIIYKSTKINKNNVLDILGEEGSLQILDEKGEVLTTIDKDTQVDDNNIFEFVYKESLSKIIIRTTKPNKVGTINLQNLKQISANVTNTQIRGIKVHNNIICNNNIEIENNKEDSNTIKIEKKEIYNFRNENIAEKMQKQKLNSLLTKINGLIIFKMN